MYFTVCRYGFFPLCLFHTRETLVFKPEKSQVYNNYVYTTDQFQAIETHSYFISDFLLLLNCFLAPDYHWKYSWPTERLLVITICLNLRLLSLVYINVQWYIYIWLTDCMVLTMVSILFQLYRGGQITYTYFSWVPVLPVFRTILFSSHWLVSNVTGFEQWTAVWNKLTLAQWLSSILRKKFAEPESYQGPPVLKL